MQDGERITLTSFGWDYLGYSCVRDNISDCDDSTGRTIEYTYQDLEN